MNKDFDRDVATDPFWIGMVGAAKSGKTTVADRMGEIWETTTPYLAQPIKDVAQSYYGMTDKACYTQEGKSQDHDYIAFDDGTAMTNRNVLEQIGDKLQELDPLVLLRAAERRLENEAKQRVMGGESEYQKVGPSPKVVAFPDLRTEPQAQFIRDKGGLIVYVDRKEAEKKAEAATGEDAHHTKTFYNRTEHDFRVDNNGGLEELWDEVYRLMAFLRHLET